ncbi:MAG: GGDEF domain-containing protein [Lachnospiraceae bacterium]|nr:GGDEF domain-containing protein [Lachnospiraceae bacterium]
MGDKNLLAELEEQQNREKEGYKELLEVYINTPMDLEAYFEVSQKALLGIADALMVGKVEVSLDIPSNPILPAGYKEERALFQSEEGFSQECYSETYSTTEQGIATYTFYSKKGTIFTEENKKELHHMTLLLYGFGGRARMGQLLQHVITHDIATGIPNLSTFIRYAFELNEKNTITDYDAYFLNTKNFKYINRIVKYQQGDVVMMKYASKLRDFLAEGEIVARLGGDNYVALIRRDRSKEFQDYISGIEITIDTERGMKAVVIGAVAGVYEIREPIVTSADIMMPISMALQTAKSILHQDVVYYTKDLSQRILEGQKVVIDFDECLEKGEYVVYLQPKVRIADETICGAEALARWIHEGQMISPATFIPALEKDGTICKLDFEILRQVCVLIKRWVSEGKDPGKISVNFSRWNLRNINLVEDVMKMLNEYDVDPKYIELELTETMELEEYAMMANFAERFKKIGIATSIDDFGTGHSSLSLLKNLEVEVLKIDREFIKEIGNYNENKKDRVILSSVISMAKAMDMQVLAEGVETVEQKQFLKDVDCDMFQGFLFSKPLPVDEFEKMVYAK